MKALIAPLLLLAATAHADPVQDLKQALNATQTLSATFSQRVIQRNGHTETSRGEMALSRPGKFRWVYTQPYPQTIVSDGQSVWLYDPDLAQVTVKPFAQALDASPAALLAGNQAIDKTYLLKALPEKDGWAWVSAKPKQDDASFSEIRIALQGETIRAMELVDRFDQTTRIDFSNLKRNAKLASEQFTFKAPDGVDVVRE
ncbi:outer membrane lipoprotein chaperone LolA [Chitinibacteraceae bacterium HSL-7]